MIEVATGVGYGPVSLTYDIERMTAFDLAALAEKTGGELPVFAYAKNAGHELDSHNAAEVEELCDGYWTTDQNPFTPVMVYIGTDVPAACEVIIQLWNYPILDEMSWAEEEYRAAEDMAREVADHNNISFDKLWDAIMDDPEPYFTDSGGVNLTLSLDNIVSRLSNVVSLDSWKEEETS